jgi:hypothetical protein
MRTISMIIVFSILTWVIDLNVPHAEPTCFATNQYRALKMFGWNACMEALKDSSIVSSDDRDEVCEDVASHGAFAWFWEQEGRRPCQS